MPGLGGHDRCAGWPTDETCAVDPMDRTFGGGAGGMNACLFLGCEPALPLGRGRVTPGFPARRQVGYLAHRRVENDDVL